MFLVEVIEEVGPLVAYKYLFLPQMLDCGSSIIRENTDSAGIIEHLRSDAKVFSVRSEGSKGSLFSSRWFVGLENQRPQRNLLSHYQNLHHNV